MLTVAQYEVIRHQAFGRTASSSASMWLAWLPQEFRETMHLSCRQWKPNSGETVIVRRRRLHRELELLVRDEYSSFLRNLLTRASERRNKMTSFKGIFSMNMTHQPSLKKPGEGRSIGVVGGIDRQAFKNQLTFVPRSIRHLFVVPDLICFQTKNGMIAASLEMLGGSNA